MLVGRVDGIDPIRSVYMILDWADESRLVGAGPPGARRSGGGDVGFYADP